MIRQLSYSSFVAILVIVAICGNPGSGWTQDPAESASQPSSPFGDEEVTFQCSNCGKEVPESVGAGQNCPHCGAFFATAENADGTTESADPTDDAQHQRMALIRNTVFVLLGVILVGRIAYRFLRRS